MSTGDKAAIVAAAIASAERETPKGECPARYYKFEEGGGGDFYDVRGRLGPQTGFARLDVVDTALRHLAERVEHSEAEARALREALRKVQTCCQYTGAQQILMVAVDVKVIVDSALAAKAVVP